jgi:hypothetical protein
MPETETDADADADAPSPDEAPAPFVSLGEATDSAPVPPLTAPFAVDDDEHSITFSTPDGDPKVVEGSLEKLARAYLRRIGQFTPEHVSRDGIVRAELSPSIDQDAFKVLCNEIETSVGRQMSRTLHEHARQYVTASNVSGTTTKICGDGLSQDLLALTPEQVSVVASSLLGLDASKYDHLNPGQVRMNWGNRLRAALKKGVIDADALADAMAVYKATS